MACALGALAFPLGYLVLDRSLSGPHSMASTRTVAQSALAYGGAWAGGFVLLVALRSLLGRRDERVDADTGLWSRGHLEERLQEEIQRATRAGAPLAIVMVELAGIGAANRHLTAVANTLRRTCRKTDVVGRYEPDSFIVVTPATDSHGALVLANRIRTSVLLRYIVDRHALPPAPVTLGVTHLDAASGASGPADLVRAAAGALDRARQMGGDCAVLAAPRAPAGSEQT